MLGAFRIDTREIVVVRYDDAVLRKSKLKVGEIVSTDQGCIRRCGDVDAATAQCSCHAPDTFSSR